MIRIHAVRSQELGFVSNRLFNSRLIGDLPAKGNYKVHWNLNTSLLNQDLPDLGKVEDILR